MENTERLSQARGTHANANNQLAAMIDNFGIGDPLRRENYGRTLLAVSFTLENRKVKHESFSFQSARPATSACILFCSRYSQVDEIIGKCRNW